MREWQRKHRVRLIGNRAFGGDPHKRWVAVALAAVTNCESGTRRNFYSQLGPWDCFHEIIGGPPWGYRSDCASTVTGFAWSTGLRDPNGEDWSGGYTGTLADGNEGWHEVSEGAMRERGWGYIVYGWGTGHHVEAYIGGGRTVGHGAAPINVGIVNLFGDGVYRCYVYR